MRFIINNIRTVTALAGALAAACGSDPTPASLARGADPSSAPLALATAEEADRFDVGDRLFELTFREADGLGPLYIRSACASCHRADGRGPGLVGKMSVVEADGLTPATDQSRLPFGHTIRPYVSAGATRAIEPPAQDTAVRVTYRLPPPVFGRGYLEAVTDQAIEALAIAAQARTGPIRGRIHRVRYNSEPNPDTRFGTYAAGQTGLIGRFGLKARIVSLDEFTADAFQGDMGMTSPLRPTEPANPDSLGDDRRPGVDLPLDTINAVADYMRLLEIPTRMDGSAEGRALFAGAACAACHVPTLPTRSDYPIAALAGIEAPVYTDFLLHDLGAAMADGLVDGEAGSREWRTAPLIGLRFSSIYLHDGRAHDVEAAILGHEGDGSEANASVAAFRALTPDARATLIQFVAGL